MRKFAGIYLLVASVIAFLSGCVSVDYVGQKLTPLKKEQRVVFFNSKSEVPPNTYKVIGRATAEGPDDINSETVKEKLIKKARECGADAIQVVTFKRIKVGVQRIPQRSDTDGTVGNWMTTSNRADGSPIYTSAFDRSEPLAVKDVDLYKFVAKVLFLADKQKYNREFKEFEEARQRYMHNSSEYAK
jgi:hypothetical protein